MNLTTFEIVCGTASTLTILFTVGGVALKIFRTYRTGRREAEEELVRETKRLKAAGSTVSARTDLGFFVLMRLASLRDSLANYRFFCMAVLHGMVVFTIFLAIGPPTEMTFFVVTLGLLAFSAIFMFSLVAFVRLHKYTVSFERRIKEVWRRPIDKRLARTDD